MTCARTNAVKVSSKSSLHARSSPLPSRGVRPDVLAAAHRFGPDPVTTALEATVADEMRIAADVAKYQGASLSPSTIATTASASERSPFPIHLSLSTTTAADASVTLDAHGHQRRGSHKSRDADATRSRARAGPRRAHRRAGERSGAAIMLLRTMFLLLLVAVLAETIVHAAGTLAHRRACASARWSRRAVRS